MPTAHDLSRFAVFADIQTQTLERLAQLGEVVSVAQQNIVFHEGDTATHLYLVLSGEIDASKSNSAGQRVSIHTLGPGDFAGLTGLFINKPRSATLTAQSDCTLWRIAKSDIHQVLVDDHALATSLIRYLSLRYRSDARSIAEVPTHSDANQPIAEIAVFDAKPYDAVSFKAIKPDEIQLRFIEHDWVRRLQYSPRAARLSCHL